MNKILCIGGINIDWTEVASGDDALDDATSRIYKSTIGGVVYNIAHNLKDLGRKTKIISAVGCDGYGDIAIQSVKQVDIGCKYIARFGQQSTASVVYSIGSSGEVFLDTTRLEIYSLLNSSFFEPLLTEMSQYKSWVIDTNLTTEAIAFIAPKTTKLFTAVAAPPLAERVIGGLYAFDALFLNREEASCLMKKNIETYDQALEVSDFLRDRGVVYVFLTLDKDGVCVNSPLYRGIVPAMPAEIHDPQGAGDAFASAVINDLVENTRPIQDIIYRGLAASCLAVEAKEQNCGMLTLKAIEERSRRVNY